MPTSTDAEGSLGRVSAGLLAAGRLVSTATAERIALDRYGLRVRAKQLSGEKDCNFHINTDDGREFLLKVVNPAEDPGVTNFQTMALLHVEASDPAFPCQRVLRALNGYPETYLPFPADGDRAVRIVSYTRGALQRNTVTSEAQLRNIGIALGRLQLALAMFRHPSDEHELTWDLMQASSLWHLLPAVEDGEKRRLLERQLDFFERNFLPDLRQMRAQVVHNDLNSDNVVVNPADPTQVVGIIDFGDIVRTAIVIDAAVGAAYQLSGDVNPLDTSLRFLAGFHSVQPLTEVELDLLYDLIVTRMVTRIAITEWRAARFPENRNYILRNTPRAWMQFDRLRHVSRQEATVAIRRACSTRSI